MATSVEMTAKWTAWTNGSQPFVVCGPVLKALNTRGPLLSKKFFVYHSQANAGSQQYFSEEKRSIYYALPIFGWKEI